MGPFITVVIFPRLRHGERFWVLSRIRTDWICKRILFPSQKCANFFFRFLLLISRFDLYLGNENRPSGIFWSGMPYITATFFFCDGYLCTQKHGPYCCTPVQLRLHLPTAAYLHALWNMLFLHKCPSCTVCTTQSSMVRGVTEPFSRFRLLAVPRSKVCLLMVQGYRHNHSTTPFVPLNIFEDFSLIIIIFLLLRISLFW